MRQWYVVHTQPQAESRAVDNLRRQGYEAYLPRYRKWRRHARRSEIVAAALFPRYLFVRLDITAERWRPILSTFGVCGLILQGGMPAPVPEGIVEGIQAHEDATQFVDLTRQADFHRGDRVQVVAGPFADYVGLFEGASDEQRVILLLELLGRKLRIELPAEAVTACA